MLESEIEPLADVARDSFTRGGTSGAAWALVEREKAGVTRNERLLVQQEGRTANPHG
jgi:hypothetical protein